MYPMLATKAAEIIANIAAISTKSVRFFGNSSAGSRDFPHLGQKEASS